MCVRRAAWGWQAKGQLWTGDDCEQVCKQPGLHQSQPRAGDWDSYFTDEDMGSQRSAVTLESHSWKVVARTCSGPVPLNATRFMEPGLAIGDPIKVHIPVPWPA